MMSLMQGFIWGPHLGNGESFHSACRFQIFPPHCFALVILSNESIWFLTFSGLQLGILALPLFMLILSVSRPKGITRNKIQSKAALCSTLWICSKPHTKMLPSLHLPGLLSDYQKRGKSSCPIHRPALLRGESQSGTIMSKYLSLSFHHFCRTPKSHLASLKCQHLKGVSFFNGLQRKRKDQMGIKRHQLLAPLCGQATEPEDASNEHHLNVSVCNKWRGKTWETNNKATAENNMQPFLGWQASSAHLQHKVLQPWDTDTFLKGESREFQLNFAYSAVFVTAPVELLHTLSPG